MRTVCGLIGLLCCASLLAGCSQKLKTATEEIAKPAIPVEAERPVRDTIFDYLDTTTRVTAERQVDVLPQASERCVSVHADEGDWVEKGQVLAELDKDELTTQLRETETQVEKQKADYLRAKQLAEEGLGPPVEAENAKFAWEQGQSSLERIRLQLANMTIRSPLNGIVAMRNVQVGQLVSMGTPIYRLVDPESYMLKIYPMEQQVARLKAGQIAKVSLDAVAGQEFDARVRKISPVVDAQTGTVTVVLDFDANTANRLRDSAFARVRLVLDAHEDALLIPKDAVVEENARKYVFILDQQNTQAEARSDEAPATGGAGIANAEDVDEKAPPMTDDVGEVGASDLTGKTFVAERVEIMTGLEDSNRVEVLSGVDGDTYIVTLGQHNLKSGSEVKVTNAGLELRARSDMSAQEALDAAEEARQEGAQERSPDRRRM